MKNIFLVVLFFGTSLKAQTFIVKSNGNNDQTATLQSAFNDPSIRTVSISSSGRSDQRNFKYSGGENDRI